MNDPKTPEDHPTLLGPPATFGRQLLHRWFIEYNPLYLLSALLVLGGMFLVSRGLNSAGSVHKQIAVAAIAELYALALIGGTAFLTRIGQRRPAVMLAFLTILYQYDLTLHTEACVNLGTAGVAASFAWLALFVAKMLALAWSTRVRIARVAAVTMTLAGIGLALLPHLVGLLSPRVANAAVGLWLFALFAISRAGTLTSRVELDGWGQKVLRRAERATWIASAMLLALHVMFWSLHSPVEIAPLLIVLLLSGVRRLENEAHAWSLSVGVLIVTLLALPSTFSLASFVAALALAIRATGAARAGAGARAEHVPEAPYRALGLPPTFAPPPATAPLTGTTTRAPGERRRLLTGAGGALYLSVWTLGWEGRAWPQHDLWLDVVATVAVALVVWRLRPRVVLAPVVVVVTWMHFLVESRLVPPPRSTLEWGGAAIVLGFVLLFGSLLTTWILRKARPHVHYEHVP